MSLINQMLKDLDARTQHEANHSGQEVEVVVCHPPQHSRTLPIIVALVVVLVGSAIGGWWFLYPRPVVTPPIALRVQPQVTVEAVVIEPQPVALAAVVEVAVAAEEQVVALQAELLALQQLSQSVVAPGLAAKAVLLPATPVINASVDRAVAEEAKPSAAPLKNSAAPLENSAVALENSPLPVPARVVIKTPSLAEQAQQLRIDGRALIQQRRYRAGAQRLNQALQMEHSSGQPWQELVRACVQAGDLPSALDAVKRGCEAYPNDIGLRVYHARLIVESGDYDSALIVLQTGA
ncbi:MAG: tetratricopeptide repeat protein, partial [Deltaproteobacteria bacterium]|nr:tetratricopeptide repeat protein [Deltaproteobacteria bacterium]